MADPTLTFRANAAASNANSSLFDLIEQLTERLNRQESIDFEAVLVEHPEHADELRKVWPSLAILAELRSADGKSAPSFPPDTSVHAGTLTGTLGDYRILKEIGRGGMGVVYEAEQISLGRHVALKVLPFAGVLDERQLQRFKNEALAAAHLNHPHIVDVYGVGCERGVHFYTMRLIDGVSVQQLISELREYDEAQRKPTNDPPARSASEGTEQSVPTPTAETPRLAALSTSPSRRKEYYRNIAQLGIDAAEALHHAHEQGVIHRDIKPSNLMLDGRGKLWVTDFGLAQIETGATLTMTGELIGTLRYMSPEQASGQRLGLDHRCDVYSLGATLYELLTLQPPFTGENRAELLQQILFHDPKLLRKVRPDIPVDLETIIAKAMAKVPGERYTTAQELAEDLKRVQSDRPIVSRRVTTWGRLRRWARRNPVVATLLTLFVTTLIAGTTVSTIMAARATEALNDVKEAEEDYRREHERAQENLYNAAETVQKLLTRVAQEELFQTPGATEIRRQLLIEAGAQLSALSKGQQDPRLLSLTASAYRDIGIIHHHCGDHSEAVASLEQALRIHEVVAHQTNEDDSLVQVSLDRFLLAEVLWYLSRPVEADTQLTMAVESIESLCLRAPGENTHFGLLRDVLRLRGLVHRFLGNSEVAEADLRRSIELGLELILKRNSAADRIEVVRCYVFLAKLYRSRSDADAAKESLEHAATMLESTNLAVNSDDQGKLAVDESFPIPAHLMTKWVSSELFIEQGNVFELFSDEASALEAYQRAVDVLEPIARDYPDIIWSRSQLASAYAQVLGIVHGDEAAPIISSAAELIQTLPDNQFKSYFCNQLVWNCVADYQPSKDIHPELIPLARAAVRCEPSPDSWNTLGVALYRAGDYDEAIAALTEAEALDSEGVGYNAIFLAMAYWQLGENDNAKSWYEQGVKEIANADSIPRDLTKCRAEAESLLGSLVEPNEPSGTQ